MNSHAPPRPDETPMASALATRDTMDAVAEAERTQALGNGINRLGQGRGHSSDGFLGTTILVREQLHQRQGVELIQA